jgi:hypothetical protein
LLVFALWRAVAAALLALVLARIDAYVERRHRDSVAGRAWRAYRGARGTRGVSRGTPAGASRAIETRGRPRT